MHILVIILSLFSSISGIIPRFFQRYIRPINPSFPKGFYGLIGPNVNTQNVKTLFDLFTGDGIIQGVFIEPNNITFVKHIVRTNKWKHGSKYNLLNNNWCKHPWMLPFFIMGHKMGIIPNVLDLANTAFLSVKNKTYALFERDYPYEISFNSNQINTLNKINIGGLQSFSGHSKYNGYHIHTIDYDVILKRVRYMVLDDQFREHAHIDIQMKYIPLVHDFYMNDEFIIMMDSPFCWDFSKRLPVILDKSKTAFFHVLKDGKNIQYLCKDPFYIFHYADVKKRKNGTVEIYAACYDDVNFSALDICGKYRKIVINSLEDETVVYRNKELENMNLDFPIKYKDYVVLREIINNTISGFVVCRELDIVKRVYLPENRFFCGEPCIFEERGSPFLIGFSYDENQMGYVCVLNIFTNKYIEHPLNTTVTIGFHSILSR